MIRHKEDLDDVGRPDHDATTAALLNELGVSALPNVVPRSFSLSQWFNNRLIDICKDSVDITAKGSKRYS